VHAFWLTFFLSLGILLYDSSPSLHDRVYCMNELMKIDKRLCVSFSAVALLHVVHKMSRKGFTDDDMDILSTIGVLRDDRYRDLSLHKAALNTPEMVELLQKSAVDFLTTYRQNEARDFGSVAAIVTIDFEALYAYKRGDYQRCLQLSTQNVYTLLSARRVTSLLIFPEFIQLLDDDIVSLTALTMIVNPKCRDYTSNTSMTQLTLSLYLMTQCQLKLHHSVTSLAQTLHYIKVAQRRHSRKGTLDRMTLKLIERKVYLDQRWNAGSPKCDLNPV